MTPFEALQNARTLGEVEIKFSSPQAATAFRFQCYRIRNVNEDFSSLILSIKNSTLLITKAEILSVTGPDGEPLTSSNPEDIFEKVSKQISKKFS